MKRAILSAMMALGASAGSYMNPIIPGDMPDPGAINVDGTFYVATTSDSIQPPDSFNATARTLFPIHSSTDLGEWTLAGHVFPNGPPTWATADFWAAEIHSMIDGTFVVYYTARDHDNRLSIGAATGATPVGPFTDIGEPLARDSVEGGGMYLDAHYFYDRETEASYLVWKRGTVTPPVETFTVLYIQQLDSSGTKLVGQRSIILENDLLSWEEGVVEAPWIVKPPRSEFYYLFYSAADCCYGTGTYAVGVARAKAITGPYEKYSKNPILKSNSGAGFSGTGHCSVLPGPVDAEQWLIFYHGFTLPLRQGNRSLLMDTLYFDVEEAAVVKDTGGGPAGGVTKNGRAGAVGWPRIATGTGSASTGPQPLPPTVRA
jgi:beta-xylosidase